MLVLWMQETQSGPFGPLFLLQISEKTRIARDTMKKVTETVRELALPVVEENGCKLWDVEYVREAGQWYLRIYIDKDGGVNILDCEAISRRAERYSGRGRPHRVELHFRGRVRRRGAPAQAAR